MAESKVFILILGTSIPLLLAFTGLFVGAWFAQFIMPTFPTVFLIPIALNVVAGALLIRGRKMETGKAVVVGGVIVSLALPFILL